VAKVIITMPAYRAEGTLEKTVADIPQGVADELILVDDASGDETAALARNLGINVFVHPENRGYGGNQKTCYQEALRGGADVVVLLHPDYQYDPRAVPLLIAPILAGRADMTFGSRFAGLGDPMSGGMPLYRYVGNRTTTVLENLMLGSRFTELHSGMRAYTRECLLSLPFLRYSNDFLFDSQLLVDAVLSGHRVVEVPIPTRYTEESSSISVGRSVEYVAGTLGYCARRSIVAGRRGRRSPVTIRGLRRGPSLGSGPPVERKCVLCGGWEQVLVIPANASGSPRAEEFACTTPDLALHDEILQCRRCGMVSSVPRVSDEEIRGMYRDVVDETYLAEEGARRELFEWVLQSAEGHVTGARLLEIGASVGLLLEVARRRGWQPRGIEPSAWAVELGRERYGVELGQGTAEDLSELDASADVVVMLDVLEHLADPLGTLRRVRPVLDDTGLLVLSTVNLSGLHARLRQDAWPWFIRSHLHYFSPETLHATLTLAGFRMVEWSAVPRSFHLSYIAHRAGRSHGAMGRAIETLSRYVDPRIPIGWLGDIAFVAARPADPAS
jgi:glycosyltransferase involved in cell wall biosynthesis/2-polyprenyl-3-methyl-5-hydroxy-6-metoxy-1,4-benzoquinol methylase